MQAKTQHKADVAAKRKAQRAAKDAKATANARVAGSA